ncbi:hypothetical protein GW17_00044924 [Ensete ventricosum]|nr:hypothetical protein GW17_00044924 [Ensete ventricosum]
MAAMDDLAGSVVALKTMLLSLMRSLLVFLFLEFFMLHHMCSAFRRQRSRLERVREELLPAEHGDPLSISELVLICLPLVVRALPSGRAARGRRRPECRSGKNAFFSPLWFLLDACLSILSSSSTSKSSPLDHPPVLVRRCTSIHRNHVMNHTKHQMRRRSRSYLNAGLPSFLVEDLLMEERKRKQRRSK